MEIDLTTIIVAIIGSGILNTILSYVISCWEKKKNGHDDNKKALRLIMKDRLRYLCNHYINQGWIYSDELDDLISMHGCYHSTLGGNGYLDELMKRVKSLEVRGIGVK